MVLSSYHNFHSIHSTYFTIDSIILYLFIFADIYNTQDTIYNESFITQFVDEYI